MYTTWTEKDAFKESETYVYLGGEVGHQQPGFGALQAPLAH